MKKKKSWIEGFLVLVVLLGMIGVFFAARNFGFTAYANEPVGTNPDHSIELEIKEGDNVVDIAARLEEEELIKSQAAFCFRSKFSEYNGLIKAGTYTIDETMGTDDILAVITQTQTN